MRFSRDPGKALERTAYAIIGVSFDILAVFIFSTTYKQYNFSTPFKQKLNPSRPYKCVKDIIDDDSGRMFTVNFTLNLFDVNNWCECNNELDNIKDDVKRTVVFLEGGTTHIIRVSYKEFDAIILQLKDDYKLLDNRSMIRPDKEVYKGFIKATGASKKQFMVCTFHRKGYKLWGNSERDFEDFRYHALFNYTYPMN